MKGHRETRWIGRRPPHRRGRAVVTQLLICVALCGTARADDEREAAAADFREGAASFARGDHRAAATSFESAFRRRPHGAAAYNAGLAWQAAEEGPRAADAYDTALRHGGLEPGEAADAERRLRGLERALGRVDVSAPTGARVSLAHADGVGVPARIHVTPGSYQLRVVFSGGQTEARPIAVAAGAELPIAFEEPKAPAPAAAPARRATAPAPRSAPEPDRGGSRLVPTLGWVALGCGAAAAGAAIALGTAALDARDEYNSTKVPYTDVDAYDRARSLRTWTNVSWVAAAGFAATGGVLLVVGLTSQKASRRATVAVSPRSLLVRGTF